jgi:aminoglycoside phosphotransferase family enzyme/predicted kinase
VFLFGAHAYKIKRAVKYPYLDFSTLALRKAALDRELALNKRTAPAIYEGVVSVNRDENGQLLPIGSSSGVPVEWALKMTRFDTDAVLDRIAARGELDLPLIEKLATEVAAFHRVRAPRPEMGGAQEMMRLVDINARELRQMAPYAGIERLSHLAAESRTQIARLRPLIEQRRQAGFVRHCHGDLHLGNIVMIDGIPTLFDCIEFDDRLACSDILYDLAFLLMDLLGHKLPAQANRLLNSYFEAQPYTDMASTLDGLALLPVFLSCRAAIRAHVTARNQEGSAHGAVCAYVKLSEDILAPTAPVLIAIGGLSGSGKSTLARMVAPSIGGPLGAVVLRSDVIRKKMLSVPLGDRLDEAAYDRTTNGRVYEAMINLAGHALRAGHSVLLDAVFSREDERASAENLAKALGVPFHGVWLSAPHGELVKRLQRRVGDVSDATGEVLERQRRYDLGRIDWTSVETSEGTARSAERLRACIGASPPDRSQ